MPRLPAARLGIGKKFVLAVVVCAVVVPARLFKPGPTFGSRLPSISTVIRDPVETSAPPPRGSADFLHRPWRWPSLSLRVEAARIELASAIGSSCFIDSNFILRLDRCARVGLS